MLDAKERQKTIGLVALDDRNRITISKAALQAVRAIVGDDNLEKLMFKVVTNDLGHIILQPEVSIPAHELWLWKNSAARESVLKGLKDAEEGKLVDRGSFAKFADVELDD